MNKRSNFVAGVDEAGRGPLAGPVYAAAVILDARREITGLADSKALSAKMRQVLADAIRQHAIAWAVASSSVEEIDVLNIHHATLLAMKRAVDALLPIPDRIEVDGLFCPQVTMPARAIVAGDRSVAAIAAASILAKTARDAELRCLHELYPQYGLDRHKGYPTAMHLAALERHGASIIHRRSFAPVRRLIEETSS